MISETALNKIYSDNDVTFLLGILCNDTSKCTDSKYPLEKEDFECVKLHQIVYSVIYNLAIKGVKNVDSIMISEFLSNYPPQEEVYKDNNGNDFIETMIDLTKNKTDNIYYYWESTRKHSLLREYGFEGIDINDIWDIDKKSEENEEELNKWSIEDICNHFDAKQSKIRKSFLPNINTTEMICGDGFDDVLDELEETPMIGAGLVSGMLNELYRGWGRGHLILRGAPSSFGKTAFGITDHLNVSSIKLWSEEKHDFIDNPYYHGMGAYIHTEQKTREEIQTRAITTLAHIPYNKLLDGAFTKDERERLSEAGKILKASQFKLINYPSFTLTGTKEVIKDLSLDGYEYITHDYIWNNLVLIEDIRKKTGISVGEPSALLSYSNELKLIAEEFNVGIATMMQLNDTWKTAQIIDEGCLYASKAVKTKLDNGSILTPPRPSDIQQLESLIIKWNKKFNKDNLGIIYPNAVSNCFKTRYGKHGQNIRVWHHVNRSIGTMTDMFATTWDNKLLTDEDGNVYELIPKYIERVK